MNEVVFEIEGVEIKLHFQFSTLYKLGRKWNLKTIDEIIGKIIKASDASKGVQLDSMDVYSEIILLFAPKLQKDVVIDYLFANQNLFLQIVDALIESIQNPSTEQKAEVEPGK